MAGLTVGSTILLNVLLAGYLTHLKSQNLIEDTLVKEIKDINYIHF